jgi:exopolysaccharide biosynthesis polyprenyl glycosylphosphotransferase
MLLFLMSHQNIRNKILKECYKESKRVFMTPKISDIIIRGSLNIHLFDTPLLLANNRGLKLEQRFIKRLFDIVVSLLALIILFVPLALISLLIKFHDKGPVFYTQERLTRGGKVFQIIKFRSMRVDSEADQVARLASLNDERITPLGKILRATHVDELPQLINILKGDMSLVGPRPERPDIAKLYEENIPEFSYRLKVKAGLSGYAQVFGQYNTTPADKLKLDLFYIENYSFIRDLHIILLTVKIMFMKEKSEGITHDGISALISPTEQSKS